MPLFENWDVSTNGDDAIGVDAARWFAMTFTALVAHEMNEFRVCLNKGTSGSDSTIEIALRATNVSGFPTGPDLFPAVTRLLSTWPTSPGCGFLGGTFARFLVDAGVTFAIVVRKQAPVGTLTLGWRRDFGTPGGTYPRGETYLSTNSGSTWVVAPGQPNHDSWFQEFGEAVPVGGAVGGQQRPLLL